MSDDPSGAPPARTAPPSADASGATRADRRGVVRGEERARLRASFGALVWQHRLARGWTQARLAQVAGVHPDTVGRWETGALRPTDATCFKIAGAFCVDGGTALDVAALAIELELAAGPSLRRVQRRSPVRARWQRAYADARARREARAVEELDAVVGFALLAMEPEQPDPWADGRRPAVRPS